MKRICLLLLPFLIISCVPPTRFKTLQSENNDCAEERDLLKGENEKLSVENKEIISKLQWTEQKLTKAGKDTIKWKQDTDRLNNQVRILKKDYSDLEEAQKALMTGSETEIKRLLEELQLAQKDLQKRESELDKLSADVNLRKADLEKMQTELSQRNKQLAELNNVMEQQQEMLKSLKDKVSDALLGFENQGLSISQKNGKVYVSLEEKLLFKSGSTVVDQNGISALKKLALVLEQNPDINVMIEGHTDDVPVISGSSYKDNWDLSVLRATSIARIMLNGTSINPERITTAGRSQYQPVDVAKTAEARQKNRRTEIILSPKLDELFKLIE